MGFDAIPISNEHNILSIFLTTWDIGIFCGVVDFTVDGYWEVM